MLPPFTFIVDSTINLTSEPYHECEMTIFYVSGVPKNYSCGALASGQGLGG